MEKIYLLSEEQIRLVAENNLRAARVWGCENPVMMDDDEAVKLKMLSVEELTEWEED